MENASNSSALIWYPPILNYVVYLSLVPVGLVLWQTDYYWIVFLMWPLLGHLGHVLLTGFHEASHYTLAKNYYLNEGMGMLVGIVVFIPLSVYRYLHKYHHSNLSRENDYELWPYTITTIPRWQRVMAAFAELFLGFFFTPCLFLRGVLVDKKIPKMVGLRMIAEYAACVVVWSVIFTLIVYGNFWTTFLAVYLVPAMISGNLQSARKFVEHMGLLGNTPMTATRTIVPRKKSGQLLSSSIHFVNYHGTHHRFGKLAYYDLPDATDKAYQFESNPVPIYENYSSAFWDMLPTLSNPRIGPQWVETEANDKVADERESNAAENNGKENSEVEEHGKESIKLKDIERKETEITAQEKEKLASN